MNTEEIDEVIARKLREATGGVSPDFTPEEAERYRVLLEGAFTPTPAAPSTKDGPAVVRPEDLPTSLRPPPDSGTVLHLRDILGNETLEDFIARGERENEQRR